MAHTPRLLVVTITLLLASAAWADPRVPIAVGAAAPALSLPDATGGATVTLKDTVAKNKLTVLMFIATRCPVSKAYDARMAEIAKAYSSKGVAFLGINANKQEDAAEIKKHAAEHGFTFPVLKDDKNLVADLYGASVTPEIFVVDDAGVVRYHGRIDENKEDAAAVKSPDLKDALDALLTKKAPARAETKAFGCSIKRI